MTGNTSYSAILLIAPSTSAQGAIAQSNVDMTENPGEEVQHAAYGDGARTAYFIFSKQKGRAACTRPYANKGVDIKQHSCVGTYLTLRKSHKTHRYLGPPLDTINTTAYEPPGKIAQR